jgi:outer membrane lipoprotein SlyB
MIRFGLLGSLVAAVIVGGCQTDPSSSGQTRRSEFGCLAGTVTGAVAGGILGSAIGGGRGRTVATGVGVAGGGAAGYALTCG